MNRAQHHESRIELGQRVSNAQLTLFERVRTTLRHYLCGLRPGGHDAPMLDYSASSLRVKCARCGWCSDGWHELGDRINRESVKGSYITDRRVA